MPAVGVRMWAYGRRNFMWQKIALFLLLAILAFVHTWERIEMETHNYGPKFEMKEHPHD